MCGCGALVLQGVQAGPEGCGCHAAADIKSANVLLMLRDGRRMVKVRWQAHVLHVLHHMQAVHGISAPQCMEAHVRARMNACMHA